MVQHNFDNKGVWDRKGLGGTQNFPSLEASLLGLQKEITVIVMPFAL